MWQWWNGILSGDIPLHLNPSLPLLIEKSLQMRLGHLSSEGALVVQFEKHTALSLDDRYIVRDEITEAVIDWKKKVRSLEEVTFDELRTDLLRKFHVMKPELFITEVSAGADDAFSLGINFITTSPVHALFTNLIMRKRRENHPLGTFTIYHDPFFEFDAKTHGLRSSTIIALNLKKQEILIGGTPYCGEIKQSIFSVLSTILPDHGVLPMHASVNSDLTGKVSVFFGLSGTGKTTLSMDKGLSLIGDDEHGLSERGVFNFEGGLYAHTMNLKACMGRGIYQATNRFGTLMENVVLDKMRSPLFEDLTLSENGRSTFPLSALENIINDGCGRMPTNFFFLSQDAMGVLPLISQLNHKKALSYFLLGYTAKMTTDETGKKEMKATFSHCYGGPFMVRHAEDYGNLLKRILDKHQIKVWLVNTGWYGGPYGVGKRYSLDLTRACIRAIQNGKIEKGRLIKDQVFGLLIPESLDNIDKKYLHPQFLWESERDYFQTARRLKDLFNEKQTKFLRAEDSFL